MNAGVAVYGLGTVGQGLVRVLRAREDSLLRDEGHTLSLRHVVVRDPRRPRTISVPSKRMTTDWHAPMADPDVDIVVEAIGGSGIARAIVEEALRRGKSVVTANKALIAEEGEMLEALALTHGAQLRYEAAVGGAIPILHAMRSSLVGHEISRVYGVLNGTCNYILSKMADERVPLQAALHEAQALGFAEADPTADLSGLDTMQKLVILARHAFGRWIVPSEQHREGIENMTLPEVESAAARGGALKLVAEATCRDGVAHLRVSPVFVPAGDPLHGVRNESNAVLLESDVSGSLLFVGPGAGGDPTGSAVYADVVDVVRALATRCRTVTAPPAADDREEGLQPATALSSSLDYVVE